MQTKGKFILCNADEFEQWLVTAAVSRSIKLIQNHHTFSPAYGQFNGENQFSLLSGMENFHVKERGFDMIAQNLTTFPDGTVAVCRPLDRIPAGIKGANQGGICIENLGNFDSGGDTMSLAQRDLIIRVNAALCRRFGLRPSIDTIVYHHWYDLNSGLRTDGSGSTKSCPGTAFFGGNSVADAETGFIPLVQALISDIQPAAPPLRTAEVLADSLNVRNGAGMNYAIVKKLRCGVKLDVYEEIGGWLRISAEQQEWVSGRYVG